MRRYRYEIAVLLLGALSAIPYWLARTGQLHPPFWSGVIRNQFGDFSAVPLGTMTLILIGACVIWLLHRVRHVHTPAVSLRMKLLAPISATALYLAVEVGQAFGLYTPYGGGTFDWRDMLAIGLSSAASIVCVVRAHQAHAQSAWQPNRSQRLVAALVAALLVIQATAGAAGGSGSGSGGSSNASGASGHSKETRKGSTADVTKMEVDAWRVAKAEDEQVMIGFHIEGRAESASSGTSFRIDRLEGHDAEGNPQWVEYRIVKFGTYDDDPITPAAGGWLAVIKNLDGQYRFSGQLYVKGFDQPATVEGTFEVHNGAVENLAANVPVSDVDEGDFQEGDE